MRRVSNFHSNKKLLIISDYFDSALFLASLNTAIAIRIYIYTLHYQKLCDAQTCLFWHLALDQVKQGRESRISSQIGRAHV